MNGTDNHKSTKAPGHADDALGELLRLASARQRPPAEDERVVRQVLHEQWREMTRRKRARTLKWPWAIAASLLLAAAIGILLNPDFSPPAAAQQVALVDKVIGQATLRSAAGSQSLHDNAAMELMSGQTLISASGSGLALRWLNGAVIRLDERTELKLISPDEVFLSSGRIYMDTAPVSQAGSRISIRTPQGVVQHIGTQFMLRVSAAGTSISVREGEVAYFPSGDNAAGRTLAGKGQQLAVAGSGQIAISPIDTWGADWNWAEHLSAGFASDGRSLADLLAWAGRESGRQVRYSSAGAEALATATILHGDLDLRPMQAVSVATATSDLLAEVSDGLIVVRLSAVE